MLQRLLLRGLLRIKALSVNLVITLQGNRVPSPIPCWSLSSHSFNPPLSPTLNYNCHVAFGRTGLKTEEKLQTDQNCIHKKLVL